MHIHGCQKIWTIHIPKSENMAIHILSFKKGGLSYTLLKKGGFSARTPYYVIYRDLPPPEEY